MTEPKPSPEHHLRSQLGPTEFGCGHRVTPETADWEYLSFEVHRLSPGQELSYGGDDREVALVPLAGGGQVKAGDLVENIGRNSVFTQMPTVVYSPPGTAIEVQAGEGGWEIAVGGAPATGRYPPRIFQPTEMEQEVRGGGGSIRQVNHLLSFPLPAERLILYEVYVPRGKWSGWPPHCHDGWEGSPYLEETYYFQLNPADGWGFHRNYRVDTDFDESFSISHQDLVLVTQGFHSSAAAPGNHMWFLNFLAGEPMNEQRAIPPFFQPEYRWIDGNWDQEDWSLPVVRP